MNYELPTDDKALLRQCDIDVFRSSGPGGQGVNTTDSAVRLTHRPTGIVVVTRDERSQLRNKQLACKRLRQKIIKMQYRPPKRVATKPTRASQKRRVASKKVASKKKQLRRRPSDFD